MARQREEIVCEVIKRSDIYSYGLNNVCHAGVPYPSFGYLIEYKPRHNNNHISATCSKPMYNIHLIRGVGKKSVVSTPEHIHPLPLLKREFSHYYVGVSCISVDHI